MGPKAREPVRPNRREDNVKKRKPDKKKKKASHKAYSTRTTRTTLDFDVAPGSVLDRDYFVPLYPCDILMGLILCLLILCALDPEDCALIPGYRENTVRQGWIAGCLFSFLLFLNLIMTMQVLKICERNHLSTAATRKWIGQTIISGVLSWKQLRDADDMMREADLVNLPGSTGNVADNVLLGPFFLNCNKKQLAGFMKQQTKK